MKEGFGASTWNAALLFRRRLFSCLKLTNLLYSKKTLLYFVTKKSLLTKQVSLYSASSSNSAEWKEISPGLLIIIWNCSFALQMNGIVIVSAETIHAKTNIRKDLFSMYESLT